MLRLRLGTVWPAFVLGFSACLAGCRNGQDEYPELTRARRAGLIVSAEQAERYQTLSPDDVSPLYAKNKDFLASAELRSFVNSSKPDSGLTRRIEEKLKTLDAIGNSTDFSPKRNWRSIDMDPLQFTSMRMLEKAYCRMALLKMQEGDVRKSLRYLGMAANVVMQSSKGKFMIDKLVFAALQAIWIKNARICSDAMKNDKDELAGMLTLTGRIPEANHKEAIGYEIVLARQSLRPVREGKKTMQNFAQELTSDDNELADFYRRADALTVERAVVGTYAEAARIWSSPEKLLAWSNRLPKRASNLREAIESRIVPLLATLKDVELEQLAWLHSFRIALAARILRLESGRWPSLTQAASHARTSPTDPFSQNELVYQITPDSVTVYSIGRNRRNDGGAVDSRRDIGVAGF